MRLHGDGAIVALSLAAAGSVMTAPVLGRMGAPFWADVVMGAAATAGLAAFVLAALATLRAARHGPPSSWSDPEEGPAGPITDRNR